MKIAGCVVLMTVYAALATECRAAEKNAEPCDLCAPAWTLWPWKSDGHSVWEGGVGDGFKPTMQEWSVESGMSFGLPVFGSTQRHDLALINLTYGHALGGVKAAETLFKGNWEFRAELFAGSQINPGPAWLAGLTPHLRYNFATGSRLMPFIDAGAGVSLTGIRHPDLGGVFEFNLQAALGVDWFLTDRIALTAECRGLHLSSAHLEVPNFSVNTLAVMAGVTWFF